MTSGCGANAGTDHQQFILGNTFPFVVFGTFGAFWLAFAATLQPFYNSYGAYSPNPDNPAEGLNTVGFNASFHWTFGSDMRNHLNRDPPVIQVCDTFIA